MEPTNFDPHAPTLKFIKFDHALVHGNCHPRGLVCPAVLAELEGLGKVSADSSERGKTAAVGAGAKSVDFHVLIPTQICLTALEKIGRKTL